MITKFTTVYAGHVDLPDRGQDTTPANERRYSNEHLASVFEKTEAIAKKMDGLGYDTLWLAEHHFQHEGYECIPNNLMMAVHLAHVTKNIKIGCAFNIAPMWHPLRLGRGFRDRRHPDRRPHRVRGGPRLSHPRGRDLRRSDAGPERQSRAVRGAGRDHLQGVQRGIVLAQGQVLHAAAARFPTAATQLKELTLVPRPIHRPVECWQPIVSANPRGLDFMVKHGIKGAVGGGAATMQAGPITGYQEAAARAGKHLKLGENLQLGLHFHLAQDPRAGGPRDHADLRGACQDVRPVGLCPGADPGAGGRSGAARRLGCRRSADRRALHGPRVPGSPAPRHSWSRC